MLVSLLAVTILPASTIVAAVVESEGLNPFESHGIYRNIIGGFKGQLFEKDERNEQLEELGQIQLKSSAHDPATSLILNNDGDERFVLVESDGTSGTPVFMAPKSTVSLPLGFNASLEVAVTFRLGAPFMASRCVTADVDPAHAGGPLTAEPCSDFEGAKAHKTQVFRYNKHTGVIHAFWSPTSSNGFTPLNDASTGPYHDRTLSFVPDVLKTKDEKDSSSVDVTTANTAPASQKIAIFHEDGSGTVDLQEFVGSLSAVSSRGEREDKLIFAFRVYDVDRDGFISNGELFQFLKTMVGNNITDKQLQQIVDKTIMEADEDGDGRLNFEEFSVAVSTDI